VHEVQRVSQKRADRQVSGHRYRQRSLLAMSIAALAAPLPAAFAATDADNPIDIYFTDRYSYDDNLFRVPDALLNGDPSTISVQSLDDYINRASVGVQARMDASRQALLFNLRLDDVRFAKNDDLNHRGGTGDLQWDWRLGSDLSGRVLAKYDRSLASFANYRLFTRDVVETQSYAGELRYGIGSRWALLGSGGVAETDHSAQIRQIDKFKSETLRGGVEYRTPAGNVFALDYRDTSARFPIADRLPGGLPYRYDDTQTGVTAFYSFSVITQITARAAYQKRDYFDARLDDYSGSTWNVLLHWAPREKFHFDVKGWQELTAYSDAESDYYVGKGGSIAPTWEPTTKITLTTTLSYEKQDYVGINVSVAPGDASREDKVQSAKVSIDYAPRDFLSFGLGYNWIERESNRNVLVNNAIFVPRGYDNSLVSASFKITL
jgi:hypothetical protein